MIAPALLLLAQPLTLSAPLALDAPTYVDAAGKQRDVAIAPEGDGWFAVWADDRMYNRESYRFYFSEWLYGAHIDAQGVVSPPASMLVLADTHAILGQPAIAASSGGFLLAYVTSGATEDVVSIQRLDPMGLPIGVPLDVVTTTAAFSSVRAHDVGSDHVMLVAVESLGGGESRINFTMLDETGSVLGAFTHHAEWFPAVDCSATGCTVIDNAGTELVAVDLSLDGVLGDPVRFGDTFSSAGGAARVTDTTIAFYTASNGSLYAQRYANGALIDAPLLIASSVYPAVRVAARENDVAVAWTSSSYETVFTARVDANGAILDQPELAIDGGSSVELETIVWNDGATRALVASTGDVFSQHSDVLAARFEPGSGVLDANAFTVAHAANRQSDPTAAFGGGVYLLAWQDSRGTEHPITAMLIGADGTALGDPFIIAAADEGMRPRIGFDGTQFWVVWSQSEDYARRSIGGDFDIFAARISTSGAVLDSMPIVIADTDDEEIGAHLSCAGSTCFMMWRSINQAVARARRTLVDGTVLDPGGIELCTVCEDLDLAFDGSQLISVYEGAMIGSAGPLMVRRFALDLTPIDAQAIRVMADDGYYSNEEVVLTGASSTTAVAFSWSGTTGSHTILIDGTGSTVRFIEPCTHCSGPTVHAGSIAFDGRDFLIAGAGARANEYPYERMFAARLSTAAEQLDDPVPAFSRALLASSPVAVASDDRGHTLVMRSAYDHDPSLLIERNEAYLITNPRAVPAAEVDAGVQEDSSVDANIAERDAEVDAGAATAPDAATTTPDAGAATGDAGKLQPAPKPTDDGDDGCSCRASRSRTRASDGLILMLLVIGLRVVRRRRSG